MKPYIKRDYHLNQLINEIPYVAKYEIPNADTVAALNEYHIMKEYPEGYKTYSSFSEFMDETLSDT